MDIRLRVVANQDGATIDMVSEAQTLPLASIKITYDQARSLAIVLVAKLKLTKEDVFF